MFASKAAKSLSADMLLQAFQKYIDRTRVKLVLPNPSSKLQVFSFSFRRI